MDQCLWTCDICSELSVLDGLYCLDYICVIRTAGCDCVNQMHSATCYLVINLCCFFTSLFPQISNGCYNRCQASGNAKVWCPVCKQGELRDTHNLIYCTSCALRLDLGEDKVVIFTYLLVVFLYKLFLKKKL
jgi:hypothetical protein